MAAPTVVATAEQSFTAAGDPLITFTQTTGDLVLIVYGYGGGSSQTPTVSDGFNLEINQLFCIIWKVLDGSEGGDVLVSMPTNVKAAAVAYNIQGFDSAGGVDGIDYTTGLGVANQPNTPSHTPAGGAKDYLFFSAFAQAGEEADDDTWVNSGPSGYSNVRQVTSGTAGAANSNISVGSAEKATTAATVDDPGAFSTDQSLNNWNATIAVYPLAALTAAQMAGIFQPESLDLQLAE